MKKKKKKKGQMAYFYYAIAKKIYAGEPLSRPTRIVSPVDKPTNCVP